MLKFISFRALAIGFSSCLCSAGLLRDINLSLPIHWDLSNSVFFDSVPELSVNLGDKVNVLCPSQKRRSYDEIPIFQIQLVDQDTFDSCQASPKAKTVYSCDQPFDQKKLTLHFLQVSPIYDAPTFNPGQTYYFITSDEKLCKNGLKLKVHVTLGADNGIARLEEEVTTTPSYDIFANETWTSKRVAILAVGTLVLLSLLTCTLYMLVRRHHERQQDSKSDRQVVCVDEQSGRFDKLKTIVQSSGPETVSTGESGHHSLDSNPIQHHSFSAFTPYRQSVGNSLTILQTSPPWVVDLNTGEDLLNRTNPQQIKTRPVQMVDHQFYTANPCKLVRTLPKNLEERQPLNSTNDMVVEI